MTEELNEALLSMPCKERNTVIPASYLVLKRDDRVLLLRRFNTGYEDGKYSLPAGHVDAGETFTEALVREIAEEVGIALNVEDISVAHVMHRKSTVSSERIDTFFITKKWEGEIRNMEPHKCDELTWFPLESLPENTIPYIRQVLECINENKFYSEFGWTDPK